MINVDEAMACFKEFANTERGKRKINAFVERIEAEQRRKKEMAETDWYIEWLEEFCIKHPNFTDDTWTYSLEEISEQDNNNVEALSEFFDVIYTFADKNYIPYTPCDHGVSYYIKYNGKVYEIGLILGQGAVCFCNTVDDDIEANIINFEELSKPADKTLVRTALIDNQLGRIDDLLKELVSKDLNIPIYVIEDKVKEVLKQLSDSKE